MPKVYFESRGEDVDFERVCSNCEHKWTASFHIAVHSDLGYTKDQAQKSAATLMHIEKRERFENREVLCPECSHFSVDAMYRHFRKAGYGGAILKQYKRAMWMNLAGFAGFVWLPALILYLAGPRINPLNFDKPWLSIIALLVVLGFGGIALYKFVGFAWGLAGLSSVHRKVRQLSDAQLLELAVACYKGNQNSLDATSFEEVRWNAWQMKPLLYKESSAHEREQVLS